MLFLYYIKTDLFNKKIILDAFLFTNIFSLIIPGRIPFSGNQFAYYDQLYYQKLNFNTISYSYSYDYLGFHLLAKQLLINENLANLNVALFFINIFAFYSIFRFYLATGKERNYFIFKALLLIFLVSINLPEQFNQYMGVSKLLMNGTAGLGNFGLRVFTPASFALGMFFPLSMLLEDRLKPFIISAVLLSLFHYYIFGIMFVMLVVYLATKKEKNYLLISMLISLGIFQLLNQFDTFQYLSEVLYSLKSININFNLVPIISVGSIFNNGLDNSFIYYIDFENFKFYKPNFSISNFSPTIGVYNNESSIPIEKIFLFLFCIYLTKKSETRLIHNMLIYSLSVYLVSHLLFSKDIFLFHGIIQPWRINHISSIMCFIVICMNFHFRINIKDYKASSLFLLMFIPASYFIWNVYTTQDVSYNPNLKEEIEKIDEGIVLIPLSETKYVYHYGLPNIYVSIFPPIDWLERDVVRDYFDRVRHNNAILSKESCESISEYININQIDIDYLFFSNNKSLDLSNCTLEIRFIEEN